MERKPERMILPAIALRGLVIFPEQLLHFDIGRDKSTAAVRHALETDRTVFFVTQKTLSEDYPSSSDLYKIGVIARVEQVLRVPGKKELIHVSVQGMTRARMNKLDTTGDYLTADVSPVTTVTLRKNEGAYATALVREAKDEFAAYAEVSPRMPDDIYSTVMEMRDPGRLADYIAGNIMIEFEDRQKMLENLDKPQAGGPVAM